MKNAIIGFGCIGLFLGLCSVIYYFAFLETSDYYTIIDNSKPESIKDDDFKFRYSLVSYDNDGKEKTISFETSRELREGAYIKIKYMITRGVTSWEEVEYNELPSKVKTKYSE